MLDALSIFIGEQHPLTTLLEVTFALAKGINIFAPFVFVCMEQACCSSLIPDPTLSFTNKTTPENSGSVILTTCAMETIERATNISEHEKVFITMDSLVKVAKLTGRLLRNPW